MITVLSAAQVREMISIRDQITRLPGQLYMLGARGRTAGSPELERLCFDIADQLTLAQVQMDRALLLAAANKEEKEP
jgi:hypothetical protein